MFTTRPALIPLVAAAIALAAFSSQAAELAFTAKLNGAANVPEPVKTKAEGTLQLTVSADGKSVTYQLALNHISNPSQANIHLGPESMNGPQVVDLFPKHGETPKKGEFNGVLCEGTFTAADLKGSMQGSNLSDFIDELKAGNTYVNVHTEDGADPPNSGPGNYPLGEIRGQIK
jgi:hypothetical protein